jgi:hypothetical protein
VNRRKAQAAAAQQQLTLLHEARSKGVVAYRANPRPWPDGIGAWYRAEDWTDAGELIAVGEARARALDWWANDRAKGRPCPPLAGVPPRAVTTPVVSKAPVVTSSDAPVVTPKKSDRKANKARAMRDLRQRRVEAREKAEREREAAFKSNKSPAGESPSTAAPPTGGTADAPDNRVGSPGPPPTEEPKS